MKKNTRIHAYRWPLIFVTHSIAICLAYWSAFALYYGVRNIDYELFIVRTFPVVLVIKMIFFYCARSFHVSFRHISFEDVIRLFSLNSAATLIALVIFTCFGHVPIAVFILDWGICFAFLLLIRISNRFVSNKRPLSNTPKRHNIIIVGAGEAGIIVLNEYRNNPQSNAEVVAFIDDDLTKRNLRIHGVVVSGSREDIPGIVDSADIDEIIIAIPSATGEQIRSIISFCQFPGVRMKIVPGLFKIITDEIKVSVRDIKPDDLLGRETVQIDETEVKTFLSGKKVLVTGAAGSIGSELTRQIALFNPSMLILVDHNENDLYFLERELESDYPGLRFVSVIGDVKDIALLKHVFSGHKPNVVFHAAAFKHVPLMESNPSAVVENNIVATRNLVYVSEYYKVERFVFISSDKAVNPTSIMGASKRIGEMLVQAKARKSRTKFMAVRFGNVLGSKGSVVPLFKKQIEAGGPVTVMHPDVRRYFMSTREAVQLVLQASVLGLGGEVFVLDMGEQIRIVDLARDLITLAGLRPDIDIKIEFVGLRQGEKMYEEMLLDKEKDAATKHNKIYVAQPDSFNIRKLNRQIKSLRLYAHHIDDHNIKKCVKQIVPSYEFPTNI